MRKALVGTLALPLMLAACATTPLQQCQAPYRAQLRTVVVEIKSSNDILARGYRLVPARSTFGLHYCVNQFGHVSICRAEDLKDGETMYDKRAISRAAERAKLAVLLEERKQLEAALARCAAQFPE